ncbi:MAG: class I tRNA ligase family protein, partial [Mycoplasmataceae bacterium]|nr:class I tRNA ligase family protein [Mycoplasmataceae bacterium]
DVYFDVKSIKNYGEVSHNNIQDLINNVRIENDNNKKNPLDFALWKQTDLGLNWNSNWSKGRPGWHTECVVMINKYLDKQITIHGGGVDLKFPHHENENAQNYGANNCSLAQNFQYVGHLTINGQKMSKSLKNVVLAKDLLQKYQPEVIKWFFYQKYYGAPIDFSHEIMQEVSNQYNKIINAINIFKTKYYLSTKQLPESKPSYNQTFLDILNDDLNFANAVSYIQNQTKELSVSITKQNQDKLLKIYQDLIGAFIILGIHLKDLHNNDVLKEIDLWHLEVNKKNFKVADELRNELIKKKVL